MKYVICGVRSLIIPRGDDSSISSKNFRKLKEFASNEDEHTKRYDITWPLETLKFYLLRLICCLQSLLCPEENNKWMIDVKGITKKWNQMLASSVNLIVDKS